MFNALWCRRVLLSLSGVILLLAILCEGTVNRRERDQVLEAIARDTETLRIHKAKERSKLERLEEEMKSRQDKEDRAAALLNKIKNSEQNHAHNDLQHEQNYDIVDTDTYHNTNDPIVNPEADTRHKHEHGHGHRHGEKGEAIVGNTDGAAKVRESEVERCEHHTTHSHDSADDENTAVRGSDPSHAERRSKQPSDTSEHGERPHMETSEDGDSVAADALERADFLFENRSDMADSSPENRSDEADTLTQGESDERDMSDGNDDPSSNDLDDFEEAVRVLVIVTVYQRTLARCGDRTVEDLMG
ncbi:hypothetical protein SARC_08688, partial [Sphaeroforma arctica JP610]